MFQDLPFGFVLLRGLGPGALSLVSLHAVNLWFIRRRGTAIGWMGVGLALATAMFPLLIEHLLAHVGWRPAFLLVGLGLMAILLPIGALLFRAQPERFGLVPDGLDTDDPDRQPVHEIVLTLREARRTPVFWLLTLGGVCVGGLGTGLLFHHFSILASNGDVQPGVRDAPRSIQPAAETCVLFLRDEGRPILKMIVETHHEGSAARRRDRMRNWGHRGSD